VVREEGERAGGDIHYYRADLTRDEDLADLLTTVRKDVPMIHYLVHSAGIVSLAPVEEASLGDLDLQYHTNVRAPFALTRGLLSLLKWGRGHIVFVNSMVGIRAMENFSQYAATKHALRALADSLRNEVQRDDIRVTSLFLGRTATSMQQAIRRMEGKEYQPDGLIQPNDLASLILYIAAHMPSGEVMDISVRPAVRRREF
jgi:NAD(P)-dependent dehydrogenase (short-subunit alcohol dehydrogenase family)